MYLTTKPLLLSIITLSPISHLFMYVSICVSVNVCYSLHKYMKDSTYFYCIAIYYVLSSKKGRVCAFEILINIGKLFVPLPQNRIHRFILLQQLFQDIFCGARCHRKYQIQK